MNRLRRAICWQSSPATARDREGDILLVSARDGSVVRNLTKGFDQDLGFEFIVTPGGRWVTVPWFSWSATGDRLAYFARTEKSRSLILQNVLTRDIEQRVEMRTVDDPESPDFSPDGRRVAFAALQSGTGDIFILDLQTEEVTNLTKDSFADSAPTWAPDGRSVVYMARISGNEKLFQVDIATGEKKQLTFGTHDDAAAQFLDADTLVFPSTATDPAQPIDPDVARNGQIYNIWTLSLKNGELRQYTDAVSGNLFAAVLTGRHAQPKIGFVTLLQGRVRAARARPTRPDRDCGVVRLRRARPDHRLPGAAVAHARRRQEGRRRANSSGCSWTAARP